MSSTITLKNENKSAVRLPLAWTAPELGDRERRLSFEWLETDGLGGYACGTVAGGRTRADQGWYVPAIPPPRRRWLFVSGCEEFVTAGGEETGISMQIYRDAVYPEGDRHLDRFSLEPFPVWRYQTERFSVERSLCLVRDRSITIVRYRNSGEGELSLAVRPLLRFRGSRELRSETDEMESTTEIRGEISWVRPAAFLPRLYMRAVNGRTQADPLWYRDFFYRHEEQRGEESTEDLWSPLRWTWTLGPGAEGYLLFSREEVAGDPAHLVEGERRRRDAFAHVGDPLFDELARRAESFLVDGDHRDGSVIAGFPSLADRGRDAMVAAPGLALATGRFGSAARAVNAFAAMRREGLIPARFAGEEGPPEYDSVDAPLWLILAVDWFGRWRRNPTRSSPLLGMVRSVLEAYREGTRFGIRVASDGLLECRGAPGRALTWMDAIVDGEPVTPRTGRPVEVQALWHAALKSAARLERLAGEQARAREIEGQAWHAARRFNETFWFAEKEYLYDVLGEAGPDASLRPNQIFAVSLTDDLLPPHRARSVYRAVRRKLLTPFGLRTLDPADPRYRGLPGATQRDRDLAAHQGAVWPWLTGALADAHFRVLGRTEEARRTFRAWLAPLRAHIREAGLGSISESFDGDPPHAPRGLSASAWSVAEVARALVLHLSDDGSAIPPADGPDAAAADSGAAGGPAPRA
ncbi:MAG: amylo-alpha-1,6-glucosidase [Acidobacteriota bacterium]|nr:amylo-alpha-1,6-glucosidase [Acidobacteriota bacterium]